MLNNIRKPVFNFRLFLIILTSFLLFFALLPANNAFATSIYGNTVKTCPQGSTVPPGNLCGKTFCDNTGIAYTSYIPAGNCTYHSWTCSGTGSKTCGTMYNADYWAISCDKTDAQRNSTGVGSTVPPRCIPPPPPSLKCVTDSTGYTLSWNTIPHTTFGVYNGSTLLATRSANLSYRSTNLSIKSYTVKSYGGGRENAIGSTVNCTPPAPTGLTKPAPYCNAKASLVKYTWTAVAGATSYKIFWTGQGANPVTSTINSLSVNPTCTTGPGGCSFMYNASVTWGVEACNTGGCSAETSGPTYTSADCSIPACTGLTANPNNLFIGDNSNLSLTGCTGATNYRWTTTCGTLPSATTSATTTTWTAPGDKTVCTVWVYACNGSGLCSSPYTAPIIVNLHDCNGGLQTTSACVATTANTCAADNGTQTSQYTTYNGSTTCNPVNITQTCSISSCSVGNVCTNGGCGGQATPTPTPTPTPSSSPTPVCSGSTPDSCNGQCTNTQTDNNNCGICGNACTTTQACVNGTCSLIPGHTYIGFRIGMDAIGSAGDNENANPSSSNQTPGHTNRNLAVQIFDSNNGQVFAQVGSINYNPGSGVFIGTVDLGANFANGNYTVKVSSDGHLRRLIPGIQNFSSSLTQPIQLPGVNLVAGDVDSNNALNINDYNILLSCVTSPFVANIDNHALCDTNSSYIKLSDLEDNGLVNEFDYNLFLREYAVQSGD